ncbi:Ig-like domain-containing protein [Microbacterium sp. H1-D42]|uniref:Ig-like domain-containing protein n=1 Tax=Microbacterium sp. H1-D42 TaxID=2925844 RepID=UPI001F52D5AC|nr:Ig-like domain-containing protein [Microbacterium sp. H1-D42]UNK71022.1 Ig-like domain-containing protein [Microbacterium sp. H1-D42]
MKKMMRLGSLLVGAVVVGGLVVAPTEGAQADQSNVYYVDSSVGNDADKGTSPKKPWASLERVNAEVFKPGDEIRFRSGESWAGQLAPQGSGAEGEPIVIGSYGEGGKPLIAAEGLFESAVHLYNQEHWEIGDLEITNTGEEPATSARRGVHIQGEDVGVGDKTQTDLDEVSTLSGIHLHDLYIHDVNGEDEKDADGSAGIQVSVNIAGLTDQQEPSQGDVHQRTTFDDVLIENNVIDTVSRTGIITWTDWKNRDELGEGIGYGDKDLTPFTPLTDVVIRGNTLKNIGGDGITPHMTEDALVERNLVDGFHMTSSGYNVGMWVWNADGTLFQYNEVTGGNTTRDGNAFDFDHGSRGVIYQYNYSHGNDGGALLFCADGRAGGVYDGIFRYNVSQNDYYKLFTICGGANMYNINVHNNVFYVGAGLNTTMLDAQGGRNDITLSNNIFYNLGSGGYTSKPGWTYDSNIYFGNNTPSSSTIPDANAITAEPMLVAPGTASGVDELDGYRLLAGSPALGTGAAIGAGTKDIWGNVMSQSAPNRGVYAGAGELAASTGNLLTNAGFESGRSGWTWWNGTVVRGEAHTGVNAARIAGGQGSVEQTVTGLKSNTTYTLSGSVRTEGGEIRVGVKGHGGQEAHVVGDSAEYTQVSLEFTTGADATSAIVYLYKATPGNTAFGDDFALTEVDLVAPAAPHVAPFAGKVSRTPTFTGTGEPGASIEVTLGGRAVAAGVVAADGTWSATADSQLRPGKHRGSVTQTDAAGNVSPATGVSFIAVPDAALKNGGDDS